MIPASLFPFTLFLAILAGPIGLAQERPESRMGNPFPTKENLVRRLMDNRHALGRYKWKSTTEILKRGKTISTLVEEVQPAENETFERTILSDSSGKIGKKEGEYLDGVIRLARTYLLPSTLGLRETLAGGVATGRVDEDGDVTGLHITSYNQSGDSVLFWMDDSTRRAKRIEVTSRLKKDTVSIFGIFRTLPDGPDILASATVKTGKKKWEIRIQNFDIVLLDEDE